MQCISRSPTHHVLRFDLHEEILAALAEYCAIEKISAGSFSAIGASKHAVLSFYDTKKKQYADVIIDEQREIVSLTGNISIKNGLPCVHAHICLSDENMHLQGGHAKEIVVGATCELTLHLLQGTLERALDTRTGLFLLGRNSSNN